MPGSVAVARQPLELKSLVRIQAGQHRASLVYRPGSRGYSEIMFGKNMIFYFVAQALEADVGITLFAGFLRPPVILLVLAVMRHNKWL